LLVGGAAAQLFAECLGSIDDQSLELSDGLRASHDSALAGGEQDPHRLSVTAGAGCGQMVAGERFAGGADRVEVVGLGSVAPRWSGWPVDLDDPFASFE
jgi:hypothetical protein